MEIGDQNTENKKQKTILDAILLFCHYSGNKKTKQK